jgi:hypothetical protein
MFAQYKEAVYLLTGFKLERVGGGAGGPGGAAGGSGGGGGGAGTAAMYRLRSMYGEREDDHLLFQIDDRCVSVVSARVETRLHLPSCLLIVC